MQRLDKYLVEKSHFSSRQKAQQAIEEGRVFVDGKLRDADFKIAGDESIEILKSHEYVSRAALKLVKAKKSFGINFSGRTVLDIGASTGGFSQVALEGGAKKVYALDVGKDQLHESLKRDPRVVEMSGMDFRQAPKFEDVDMIVSDVSFISLRHILPVILQNYGLIETVLLFKPQFECGKEIAKQKEGIVRDKRLHERLLDDFMTYLKGFNIKISGFTFSPIAGKSGNIEYLFYLNGLQSAPIDVKKTVAEAFEEL